MRYARQDKVADRLQEDVMDALHGMKGRAWTAIERLWRRTRTDLRGFILDTYHSYFRDEPWSIVSFRSSGAQAVLNQGIRDRIDAFKHESWLLAKNAVNDIYRQSIIRHAWVLDQTTPPGFHIRIPYKQKLIEARAAQYYAGTEATQKFQQRWSSWADGYYTALSTNIQMEALNNARPQDAADEVDATTVSTPRSTLIDAYQRVFDFESMFAINDAITSVSSINEAADVVQIWETRRNLSVCDICDENEGLTQEEVDDWIPAHPNCRCYWRIVPASWAQLLRSGDDNDYATAIQMDSAGLVPNAMAILGPDGHLAGYSTVEFSTWLNDKMYAVGGQ